MKRLIKKIWRNIVRSSSKKNYRKRTTPCLKTGSTKFPRAYNKPLFFFVSHYYNRLFNVKGLVNNMPMANEMTKLLNKIERRLGTMQMNLPDYLSKDKWAREVICNETLDTFSRYFPNKVPYQLGPENQKGDYWLIDETICESQTIIGCGDIDWHSWSAHFPGLTYGGVNTYDMMSSSVDFGTYADIVQMADHISAFANGIYVEWIPPNKIKLNVAISASFITKFQRIPISLFVKHADNLKTIPPTQMEIFERLATADVATYLYEQLKMYDNLETVYANIDLKLSSLEEKARDRQQVVEIFDQSFVSAANKNQPVMLTIN
nr:MAG TPA: hypothetical protein [Caudoviricetes sp.]